MEKFIQKFTALIIFPGIVLTAATLPLKCNMSRDGGVFKSIDFGSSWEQKVKISEKQTINAKNIFSMAINQLNPVVLYVGTQGSGLYKSIDEAENWKLVEDNILKKNADIYDIKISPKNQDLIYLSVYQDGFGRILRSRNAGETWQEVYVAEKTKIPINVIEIDNFNDSIIFAGTKEGGVIKSTDYGESWRATTWLESEVSDIKSDPKNSQIVYLATPGKGMYKSTDQGNNWQPLSLTIPEEKQNQIGQPYSIGQFKKEEIRDIVIDAKDSNTLFISSDKGILTSVDAGQSWKALNILLPPDSVSINALSQDRQNPSTIYYGAGSSFYKTTNAGQTWTVVKISSSRQVNLIKVDPLDSNILYLGMYQ